MNKKKLTIALLGLITLYSCNQLKKEKSTNNKISVVKTEDKKKILIGSWIEPNPINENEVQGVKINSDGTAESINMASLLYKKWWIENNKFILVAQSIGNGSSSIDTTRYDIIKVNEKELELKNGEYTTKYKKE